MSSVKQLQPLELKNKLDNGEDIFLLDVREPWEYSLAAIEGSENFPLEEVIDRQQEFIFEDGEKFVGEWNKDGPWNIDYFDKNGELVGQMCEGEVSGDENNKTYNNEGNLTY